jgi:hypothetical protein
MRVPIEKPLSFDEVGHPLQSLAKHPAGYLRGNKEVTREELLPPV